MSMSPIYIHIIVTVTIFALICSFSWNVIILVLCVEFLDYFVGPPDVDTILLYIAYSPNTIRLAGCLQIGMCLNLRLLCYSDILVHFAIFIRLFLSYWPSSVRRS